MTLKTIVASYFRTQYRLMVFLFLISLLGDRDWIFKIVFSILGPGVIFVALGAATLPFLLIPARHERRLGEGRLVYVMRVISQLNLRDKLLPRPDRYHAIIVQLDCGHLMSFNTLDPHHLLEPGKAIYCHGHGTCNTELHLIETVYADSVDHMLTCTINGGCGKAVEDGTRLLWSDPLYLNSPMSNPFPKSEYQQVFPSA